MTDILKKITGNRVFANIIFLVVFLAGGMAVTQMVKEDLPVMAEDMVEISIAWEGADLINIEEGILRKIEMATQGMDGLHDIRTIAVDGMGKAIFLIKSGYDPKEVMDRIKACIDAISSFPEDADKPVIVRPVHSFAVMTMFLNGFTDEKTLKETGLVIKQELLGLDDVSKVDLDGVRNYEISVEVPQAKLQQYEMTISDIADIISLNNLELKAGDINRSDQRILLRAAGKKATAKQIGRIIAVTSPAGEQIPLQDIAKITDGFIQADAYVRVDGKPGILINIYKTEKEDAVKISKAVRSYLKDKEQQIRADIDMGILYDASVPTTNRINCLVKNGIYGLIFILVTLWIFIDFRLACWVAAGIPFSILGGMVILWLFSGSLNMISLFSLIMVLGIIADDAIVVGEAILHHRSREENVMEAVISGINEVGIPVLIAVLTSVTAFLPLLFIQGMMGRFIAILPLTVIACLIISLVECFVLLPAHLNIPSSKISKTKFNVNRISRKAGQMMDDFIQKIYLPFLSLALRQRYITISSGICILMITTGIILGGFLPFNLFPDTQGSVITSTIEFPAGTGISTTHRAVDKLNQALDRAAQGMKNHTGGPVVVNRISLSGHLMGDEAGEIEETASCYGSIQAVLIPPTQRDVFAGEILEKWRQEVPAIAEARFVNFFTDSIGMSEAPIAIHLMGENIKQLSNAADSVKSYLEKFEAVFQVRSDLSRESREFRLSLKPSVRSLGVSFSELSQQVRDGYFGKKALTLQRGQEEVDVYVRLPENERDDLSSLDRMKIQTRNGAQIPLYAAASIEPALGVSRIERKNRLRKVTVSAYVKDEEATADEIMDLFEDSFIPSFKQQFPYIKIAEGGDEEEENMTFDSLIFGFSIAILAIYMIIAAAFKSYLKPLLILLVIPFGAAGAVMAHLIFGHDLSLMSIFGIVAITGVLINDAIVLMDSISSRETRFQKYTEAVIYGTKRRFRAVFLTSISTVAGLMPLILETNPHIQLLIPMAVSIVGGILSSTIITLILIPAFLMILNDIQTLLKIHTHRYQINGLKQKRIFQKVEK